MEPIILGILCTIAINIVSSYIYDKVKNHSLPKSGFELDVKIKFRKH